MARRSQSQIRAQRNMRIMFGILAVLVVGSMIIAAIGPTVNLGSVQPTVAIVRTAVPLPLGSTPKP